MGKLSVARVKSAKAGIHHDGDGLRLVVKPTGRKSWVLRVQVNEQSRDIGLGTADSGSDVDPVLAAVPLLNRKSLTLAEAREKAALLRKLAKAGLDPVVERDRDRSPPPTFAEAIKLAHAELAKGWTPKHAAAFLSSLNQHARPVIGDLRVDAIDATAVRLALAPLWTYKPAMAAKMRVRIDQVLAFAKAHGWRKLPPPSAREIKPGLARQPRAGNFAAMPYADVPAFMARLASRMANPSQLALAFTVLTASRSGEVRNATWEQIDLAKGLWTRPAAIMKAKIAHVVTLSRQAVEILERARVLSGGEGLIFPGLRGKAMSDATMSKALRAMGVEGATVHGFRSAFRDWAAEQMPTVPAMVAEMALAHRVGTATEQAYLRTDLIAMRQSMMAAWGDYCSGRDRIDELAARRLAKGA